MKVLLMTLLISFGAFAQDCTEMNLITEPNSPFNKIPVYDQDGIGICYAYTAAQIIDYYLIKNGRTDRSVHPLWAALKHAEERKKDTISSGNIYEAMRQIQKQGNCHYSRVNLSLSEWAKKGNIRESEVINLIEVFATKLVEKASTKATPLEENELDALIMDTITEHLPFCSPGATLAPLIPELKALSVMNSREMLTQLILPACSGNVEKLKFPSLAYEYSEKKEKVVNEIKKQLSKRQSPIGISYCSKVLYEPSYRGNSKSEDCDYHASIIVGMKKVNNKCHFLLRNSWGTGFGKATENWKCLCKNRSTGEMVDNCTEATHNNGMFVVEACWIDEDSLGSNTFSTTWIKN